MRFPLLYQINTRSLLQELGEALGRHATLDDVPDSLLDEVAGRGFNLVWLLGVWQTGAAGREVSRTRPELRAWYAESLPDWRDEDVCGSPFAVQSYDVHVDFGGDGALARLRERLARRGLGLVLDFVVNHCAPDHLWAATQPEYFIGESEEVLAREPQNYARVQVGSRTAILAHGRDPYFPGWPDTLQLNFRHEGCREAQTRELLRIAERCDGVRCDMAMLVQPEVFRRTWGDASQPGDGTPPVDTPFWREAIGRVRREHPGFLFMAEVYWDMEWELQQEGFDYTYDKRLYDRLREGEARPVREHLMAEPGFQEHSARFLENHDEPRAAAAFPPDMHRPAAVVTFFVPGLRFFHEGQLEGRRVRTSMHLGRRPSEPVDPGLQAFYDALLRCLRRPEVHQGCWRLWEPRPAWESNGSWDQFIVFSWEGEGDHRLLAAVNYGPAPGQCYVTLDIPELAGRRWLLQDLLGSERYERDGDGLVGNGLYLDVPSWGYHLFEVKEL